VNQALLSLLLIAVPILCAGQSDAPARRPEIRPGDSWTYRGTNMLGPGTHEYESRVSFADDQVILLIATRKSDGKEFDSTWTRDWNPVTSYTGLMYRPPGGFFRFPLRIGDTYEWKSEMLRPRETAVFSSTTWKTKIAGWDTVDVPAGKFRVIRVEAEGVTETFDGTAAYPTRGTLWYEPEVRRWVKHQFVFPNFTAGEELLRYKLNED
jgi:hypothetical protein